VRAMRITYRFASRKRLKQSDGVNDAWIVRTESVGKGRKSNHYLIANEWIAGNIAQFLRLPVPPFAITQGADSRTRMFVSLLFDITGGPADSDGGILWAHHPKLCTGILAFDILIANFDRHARNIRIDDPIKPRKVFLFDHDQAICGGGIGKADLRKRFQDFRDDPYLGYHILKEFVDTEEFFPEWIKRIIEIPDWYIEELCQDSQQVGLTQTEAKLTCEFLIHRKENIFKIIYDQRHLFPKIKEWGLFV